MLIYKVPIIATTMLSDFHHTHTHTSLGDGDEESIYMCGNSLGLMPLRTRDLVMQEFDVWGKKQVQMLILCMLFSLGILIIMLTEVLKHIGTTLITDHGPLLMRL